MCTIYGEIMLMVAQCICMVENKNYPYHVTGIIKFLPAVNTQVQLVVVPLSPVDLLVGSKIIRTIKSFPTLSTHVTFVLLQVNFNVSR